MSDTIVLVHGLWMTPLSWEHWVERFGERGHDVLAPAWPGMDRDVSSLRADTASYAHLGVTEITDHYEGSSASSRARRSSWATRSAAS